MSRQNHKHFTLGDVNTVQPLLEVDTCNCSTEELISHVRHITYLVREAHKSLAAAQQELEIRVEYVNSSLKNAREVLNS